MSFSFHPLLLIWPYQKLWWEFQTSLIGYGFFSKIQSRQKLDHHNWRTFPNPLPVPNQHFGYGTYTRLNKAILRADSWSPQKSVLVQVEPSKTEEVKFYTICFSHVFCVFWPVKKGLTFGPPDLEFPQKGTSGDTHIVHFGPHPICATEPPNYAQIIV